MADTEPTPLRLSFDGPLTVRTIADRRATLLDALAGHASVHVDCTAADSVDLSFIQLLLAARCSARTAGRHFALATPPAGALRRALEQGGFLPQAGADPIWAGAA